MKDYEAEVKLMTERAVFYLRTLEDINIDAGIDQIVMSGRTDARTILGYRIPWPSFSGISLSYRYGKYTSGKKTPTHPEISYNFISTEIPKEFYDKFLELGGKEMDSTHVYKVYEHKIKDGDTVVKLRWGLLCQISKEDKELLRAMGVITAEPMRQITVGGDDTISCGV